MSCFNDGKLLVFNFFKKVTFKNDGIKAITVRFMEWTNSLHIRIHLISRKFHLFYRGKMIRTLWMIPVCILVRGSLFLINMSTLEIVVISVLLSATLIAQLIYTYVKWKGEADSE